MDPVAGIVGGILCFLGIFVAIPICIWATQTQAFEDAKKSYMACLEALKREPHNADRREATLTAGREYARRAGNKGIAFDEVALMNDINAACARASVVAEPAAPKPTVE